MPRCGGSNILRGSNHKLSAYLVSRPYFRWVIIFPRKFRILKGGYSSIWATACLSILVLLTLTITQFHTILQFIDYCAYIELWMYNMTANAKHIDNREQPWRSMGNTTLRPTLKPGEAPPLLVDGQMAKADPSGSNQIIVEPVKHLFIR